MGQSNEKEEFAINRRKEKDYESIKFNAKQTQEKQSQTKLKYITSASILHNLNTHKCSYGYKESKTEDTLDYKQYDNLCYEPISSIDSNQQQMIINTLKKYVNNIASKKIVSYLNHSDKYSSSYNAICHSKNLKTRNGEYIFQPICPYFLQSKIAIFNNYYKKLSPILNMAMIGSGKIGKSSFGLRWEQNKFTQSFFGSNSKDFYEKEIILDESERFAFIENDFGYDYKTEKEVDLKRINVDISKIFIRISEIENIYYKNIDVLFMCFAVNDKKSFQYLQNHLFKNKNSETTLKVIVGLKSEMKNESFYKLNPKYLVSSAEAMQLAKEYGIPYFEISAQTGRNVQFVVIQSIYECWFKRSN